MQEWPAAVGRALLEFRRSIAGERTWPDAQYHLSLLQMVHDIEAMIGPPEMVWDPTPTPQVPASMMRVLVESRRSNDASAAL